MATLGTPIPQKYRPCALSLLGGPTFFYTHVFWIRPEEVTYTRPTRATIVQTLGGAWADDWGEGVQEIVANGHTGWRGNLYIPGELGFLNLRELVIEQFHKSRLNKTQSGQDPDTVSLVWTDTLNDVNAYVYPAQFQLKRHKSRPLLYQFSLRLLVLDMFPGLTDLIF